MVHLPLVTLKKGREKSVRNHHPWIFSGAIASYGKNIKPGDIARVVGHDGDFLAYGYCNPHSHIAVRLLDWNEGAIIDGSWWHEKIALSIERRRHLLSPETDSCRLVYSEADLLPGLIVDKYAEFLAVQFLTAGVSRFKAEIVEALSQLTRTAGVYERAELSMLKLEKLSATAGLIKGTPPPPNLQIKENGIAFEVDIMNGQKTGWYFDQRDNRRLVASLATGLEILDCFCYTGGFSITALKLGARRCTLVDSSAEHLDSARRNLRLNGISDGRVEIIKDDAFDRLRKMRDEKRTFDIVILDPPKFAPSRKDIRRATAGYKDINLLAMKLVKSGGYLVTFSCSAAIDPQIFRMIIAWAAADCGREVQIIGQLHQAPDHPILVSFPESEYLKGFICRILY